MLEQLRDGPLSVGEVAARLPVSRPAVSQHLRVLKEAGLVSDQRARDAEALQRRARWHRRVRDYLDEFWDRALAAFKQAVEQEEEPT